MSTSATPRSREELHQDASAAGNNGRRLARARDVLMRRSLFVSDLTCLAIVVWTTIAVAGRGQTVQPLSVAYLILVPMVAKILGLYDNDDTRLRHVTLDEFPRLFGLAAFVVGSEWLANDVIFSGDVTHNQRVLLLFGITALLTIGRGVTRRFVVAALPPERCLVIGTSKSAEEMAVRFERSHTFKAEVVASVTDSMDEDTPIASAHELETLIDDALVERVLLVPRSSEDLAVARALNGMGIKVSVIPEINDLMGTASQVDDLVGLTMLGMQRPRLAGSSLAAKRIFDLTLGTVIAIVLAPLMILIAISIRLSSPGPAIYRQRRVGRHEFQFTILKFRTMEDDSHFKRSHLATLNEASGLFKITDDPRVTGIGRVLRKTSLDELPQIFNVLRGEMSLVGPRPLVPEEDVLLSGWARFRYSVLPGMTGPWQLGSAARFSLTDMASLDYLYITRWSLWEDVKTLIRTGIYVLGLHGR